MKKDQNKESAFANFPPGTIAFPDGSLQFPEGCEDFLYEEDHLLQGINPNPKYYVVPKDAPDPEADETAGPSKKVKVKIKAKKASKEQ